MRHLKFSFIISLFLIFILCAGHKVQAQKTTYTGIPSLAWPKLFNITYKQGNDEYGTYDIPVFTTEVKALEGKEIVLPGYIIPFKSAQKSDQFLFSALPLNACFFCGVGGPETAIQIFMKSPIAYTDKLVEIKGILKLNSKDPDQHIYLLENATYLGEVKL